MNLEPSEEQQRLVQAAERFLAERLPTSRFRATSDRSERSEWLELAEIGVFGLTAPLESGGMGLALADEALVFRELGRYLVTPSTLATVLGRHLASQLGQDELASRMVSGQCRAALGIEQANTGTAAPITLLLDAEAAEQILVVSSKGLSLSTRASMSIREELEPLDETMSLQAAEPISEPSGLRHDGNASLALAVLASAMLVGTAEAALAGSVEHAKQRQQFGVPIGSFQSIKHLCAENAVRTHAAWSQALWAALALQEQAVDAPAHVAAAGLLSEEAALHAAQDNVQIHGGMGFTAECDAHRYVKRQHVLSRVLHSCIDAPGLLLADHSADER